MKLSYQDYEHMSVLTLSGDYTADDVEHFNRVVGERRLAGVRDVLLDCENLEFVDSAGLESWLRLQETLGGEGGQLRLVRPDDAVKRILGLTRLDAALETHATLENAVKSLR
ncbi:MAG: STAS domain-containing protein [Planctomycetota bacterium]|nr:STAS domain-containing protein [Planctomycetota bacterium]